MSDAPDLFGPDKDELRRRLSIGDVARYLNDHEGLGLHIDSMGQALCPFHTKNLGKPDTTESFYLFNAADDTPMWWCQPCNIGGDIFHLIRAAAGLNFPGAVLYAQDILASLPPGYEPPRDKVRERQPSMEDWYNRINISRSYAAEKDGLMAVRLGFVDNEAGQLNAAHEWDLYLRESWGWGLDPETGEILMPHFDPHTGLPTGCKVRASEFKKSLPGSVYTHLYGEWLGRRHKDALILEGESDTVYAGFMAAKERIPIDVFGLPSGVNKPPTQANLDFLQRKGTIYLAFDPDAAGVKGTRAWIDALEAYGHPDFRICFLPYERDLRAARPNLRALLAHAKRPLQIPPEINVVPGGLERAAQGGGFIPITNWTIEPISRLVGGEDPGYNCKIETREVKTTEVIRLSDLASTQALNRWANRTSEGLQFLGTDNDRKLVAKYVEAVGAIVPEIFQTEQVGVQLPPEEYEFAGPTVVYPHEQYIGNVPWIYAPTGKSALDVSDRLFLPPDDDTEPFQWAWLEAFLALSDSSVTHPLLAWIVASMRRHEVVQFPLLFIGGSSGVGKSTLAERAMRLAGSDIVLDLGSITPFVLAKTLSATTTIPVFVDEWTRLSRRDSREAFQGAIPNLYYGGLIERGTADLTVQTYRATAPCIVAGEDTFELDRERDRTVTIRPSRRSQNVKALEAIKNAHLEGFAAAMHNYLLTAKVGDPLDGADIPRLDYTTVGSRPEYNSMILQAGWATLRAFVTNALHNGEEDAPDLPLLPDLTCFEVDAAPDSRENTYEAAVKEALSMRDAGGQPLAWTDMHGQGTWVRAKHVATLVPQRTDIKMPGGHRALLDYFRERYTVELKDVRIPQANGTLYAALIHGLLLEDTPSEGDVV